MIGRRTLLGAFAAAAWPSIARAAERRWTTAIPVTDFAAPDTGRPAAEALQAALDAALQTGLPLVFPRGTWIVERPLKIWNPERRRRGFPTLLGAGAEETILQAQAFAGPMLSVRGAPPVPPAGGFFLYGGEIRGFGFIGDRSAGQQSGLAVLGWLHGTISNCTFSRFRRHGIVSTGAPDLTDNPDWTASTLALTWCKFERIGDWGILDDNPIGTPAWSLDRCLFYFCGDGGLFARSSGWRIEQCSFQGGGLVGETEVASSKIGVGVRIGDAERFTINRTRIVGCEFDANKGPHIVVDRSTSFAIDDTRFIFNDRFGLGQLMPQTAIVLGQGHARSMVMGGRISRPLYRRDTVGTAVGVELAAGIAEDIRIEAGNYSYDPKAPGDLVRYRGFPAGADLAKKRIALEG